MGTQVLGIEMYDGTLDSLVTLIIETCLQSKEKQNKLISATGAHGLVHARKNSSFAELLNSYYLNVADGMPAVWLLKLKGSQQAERCYGPDLFRYVVTRSAVHNIRHFYCGGKEGVAERLEKVCQTKYGNSNSAGTFSPPFSEISEAEMSDIGRMIDKARVDILWVGLSTPKQEVFAKRLSAFVHSHFIITVGAAFDFHTGRVPQAPSRIQKIGLEWLFRLLVEPRRLFIRYVEIVPLFLYHATIDLINSWWMKRMKNANP